MSQARVASWRPRLIGSWRTGRLARWWRARLLGRDSPLRRLAGRLAERGRSNERLVLRAIRFGLAACGWCYLLFGPWDQPSAIDWLTSVGCLMLVLVGDRWPATIAFGKIGLFITAEAFGTQPAMVPKVAVAVALIEMTRCYGPRRAAPAAVAALAGCVIAMIMGQLTGGVIGLTYCAAVIVAGPVLGGAYLRAIDRERHAERARADEAERRREIAERVTRESERAAIARELHDIVAHHVASMVLRVGVARHVLPKADRRVAAVLDDVHESATTALADVRRLLAGLRAHGDVGLDHLMIDSRELPDAVAEMISRAGKGGLVITSSVTPTLAELDALRALTVLRVVQEGLTNIAKHAGPGSAARIDIARVPPGDITIDIKNRLRPGSAAVAAMAVNPAGQPSPGPDGSGHGLLGMRERVSILGGTLTAGIDQGHWRLMATLPAGAAR